MLRLWLKLRLKYLHPFASIIQVRARLACFLGVVHLILKYNSTVLIYSRMSDISVGI